MRSFFKALLISASLAFAVPVFAGDDASDPKAAPAAEKCDHGVKKAVCTRCNPKLEAVFKSKGDWCAEHSRPESQCAICHPDLKKQGVKP
jgi:hypothetical protein